MSQVVMVGFRLLIVGSSFLHQQTFWSIHACTYTNIYDTVWCSAYIVSLANMSAATLVAPIPIPTTMTITCMPLATPASKRVAWEEPNPLLTRVGFEPTSEDCGGCYVNLNTAP